MMCTNKLRVVLRSYAVYVRDEKDAIYIEKVEVNEFGRLDFNA